MSEISTVFTKVFVKEFYRLNAGFFILIITLTFGFMSGAEHRALAEFFISSPVLTMIPLAIWIVYALKVRFFNKQRIGMSENSFLFHATLLPKHRQFQTLAQTLFMQLVPAIAYGCFLIVMALKNNYLGAVAMIVLALSLMIILCSWIFNYDLRHPLTEAKTWWLKRKMDQHFVRPLWWIYPSSLLRQEPFLFLGTKVFTGLLLFSVMQLYRYEAFDGRFLAMATSLAGIANFTIMQQLQLFDRTKLVIIRNMPISLATRWLMISIATAILMVPELVVIAKYSPALTMVEIISAAALVPFIALLLFALSFVEFKNQETSSRLTFGLALVHIVLILSHVPVALFIIIDTVTAYAIFAKRYYATELSTVLKQ